MKIGFPGLLTLLFIGLKLANIITWSWLWVLSPIWIAFVFIVLCVVGMGIARALETPEQTAARHIRELQEALRGRK